MSFSGILQNIKDFVGLGEPDTIAREINYDQVSGNDKAILTGLTDTIQNTQHYGNAKVSFEKVDGGSGGLILGDTPLDKEIETAMVGLSGTMGGTYKVNVSYADYKDSSDEYAHSRFTQGETVKEAIDQKRFYSNFEGLKNSGIDEQDAIQIASDRYNNRYNVLDIGQRGVRAGFNSLVGTGFSLAESLGAPVSDIRGILDKDAVTLNTQQGLFGSIVGTTFSAIPMITAGLASKAVGAATVLLPSLDQNIVRTVRDDTFDYKRDIPLFATDALITGLSSGIFNSKGTNNLSRIFFENPLKANAVTTAIQEASYQTFDDRRTLEDAIINFGAMASMNIAMSVGLPGSSKKVLDLQDKINADIAGGMTSEKILSKYKDVEVAGRKFSTIIEEAQSGKLRGDTDGLALSALSAPTPEALQDFRALRPELKTKVFNTLAEMSEKPIVTTNTLQSILDNTDVSFKLQRDSSDGIIKSARELGITLDKVENIQALVESISRKRIDNVTESQLAQAERTGVLNQLLVRLGPDRDFIKFIKGNNIREITDAQIEKAIGNGLLDQMLVKLKNGKDITITKEKKLGTNFTVNKKQYFLSNEQITNAKQRNRSNVRYNKDNTIITETKKGIRVDIKGRSILLSDGALKEANFRNTARVRGNLNGIKKAILRDSVDIGKQVTKLSDQQLVGSKVRAYVAKKLQTLPLSPIERKAVLSRISRPLNTQKQVDTFLESIQSETSKIILKKVQAQDTKIAKIIGLKEKARKENILNRAEKWFGRAEARLGKTKGKITEGEDGNPKIIKDEIDALSTEYMQARRMVQNASPENMVDSTRRLIDTMKNIEYFGQQYRAFKIQRGEQKEMEYNIFSQQLPTTPVKLKLLDPLLMDISSQLTNIQQVKMESMLPDIQRANDGEIILGEQFQAVRRPLEQIATEKGVSSEELNLYMFYRAKTEKQSLNNSIREDGLFANGLLVGTGFGTGKPFVRALTLTEIAKPALHWMRKGFRPLLETDITVIGDRLARSPEFQGAVDSYDKFVGKRQIQVANVNSLYDEGVGFKARTLYEPSPIVGSNKALTDGINPDGSIGDLSAMGKGFLKDITGTPETQHTYNLSTDHIVNLHTRIHKYVSQRGLEYNLKRYMGSLEGDMPQKRVAGELIKNIHGSKLDFGPIEKIATLLTRGSIYTALGLNPTQPITQRATYITQMFRDPALVWNSLIGQTWFSDSAVNSISSGLRQRQNDGLGLIQTDKAGVLGDAIMSLTKGSDSKVYSTFWNGSLIRASKDIMKENGLKYSKKNVMSEVINSTKVGKQMIERADIIAMEVMAQSAPLIQASLKRRSPVWAGVITLLQNTALLEFGSGILKATRSKSVLGIAGRVVIAMAGLLAVSMSLKQLSLFKGAIYSDIAEEDIMDETGYNPADTNAQKKSLVRNAILLWTTNNKEDREMAKQYLRNEIGVGGDADEVWDKLKKQFSSSIPASIPLISGFYDNDAYGDNAMTSFFKYTDQLITEGVTQEETFKMGFDLIGGFGSYAREVRMSAGIVKEWRNENKKILDKNREENTTEPEMTFKDFLKGRVNKQMETAIDNKVKAQKKEAFDLFRTGDTTGAYTMYKTLHPGFGDKYILNKIYDDMLSKDFLNLTADGKIENDYSLKLFLSIATGLNKKAKAVATALRDYTIGDDKIKSISYQSYDRIYMTGMTDRQKLRNILVDYTNGIISKPTMEIYVRDLGTK